MFHDRQTWVPFKYWGGTQPGPCTGGAHRPVCHTPLVYPADEPPDGVLYLYEHKRSIDIRSAQKMKASPGVEACATRLLYVGEGVSLVGERALTEYVRPRSLRAFTEYTLAPPCMEDILLRTKKRVDLRETATPSPTISSIVGERKRESNTGSSKHSPLTGRSTSTPSETQ